MVTKNPPREPDCKNYGDLFDPAMKITEQVEADAYFEILMRHYMRLGPSLARWEIEGNLRQSIGYYAGYYDHETRLRVERLFRCAHPIVGAAGEKITSPTSRELEALAKLMILGRSGGLIH